MTARIKKKGKREARHRGEKKNKPIRKKKEKLSMAFFPKNPKKGEEPSRPDFPFRQMGKKIKGKGGDPPFLIRKHGKEFKNHLIYEHLARKEGKNKGSANDFWSLKGGGGSDLSALAPGGKEQKIMSI